MSAIISYLLVLLVYWMFQLKTRELLWKELSDIPQKPIQLILKTIKTQLMTLSPRNIFFQSQFDHELGLKTYRESLLLICMNRLSVALVGLFLLVSLQQWPVLILVILGGSLLFFFSKNFKSTLQVVFLAASLLIIYQFSYFTISKSLFTSLDSSLVYFLTDGRLPSLVLLLISSVFLVLIFKVEFALLILASLLFFSGGLPLTNALAMVLGEILGWLLLQIYWSHPRSQFGRKIFYEIFFICFFVGAAVMTVLLLARGYGLLNIRILGGVEDKKFLFLASWAFLEISMTIVLMVWGHFRFQIVSREPADIEPIYFSKDHFAHSGWISQQSLRRLNKAEAKLKSLQNSKSELTLEEQKMIPKPFMKKLITEVETLKTLIELLKAHN